MSNLPGPLGFLSISIIIAVPIANNATKTKIKTVKNVLIIGPYYTIVKVKSKSPICKKCGHKETLENINYSATSKILIAQVPRVRKKDGLDIYPLYCLKCNFITEWAADPNNISGKAVDGVEYFKTFKINKKYKEYFTDIEDNFS